MIYKCKKLISIIAIFSSIFTVTVHTFSLFKMILNPNIGPKHFSSELNRNRKSVYTPYTAIAELVDNAKDKFCKNVIIDFTEVNEICTEIKISDDCECGLQGLMLDGVSNPGNLGYTTDEHDNCENISENGIGGKAACHNLANVCQYLTYDNSNKSYIMAENNYKVMCKTTDVTRSYDFTKLTYIDQKLYTETHPFVQGTSIILSDLEPMALKLKKNNNTTTTHSALESYLLQTYGKTGINISIKINGELRSLPAFRSPLSHSSSAKNTIIHNIVILKPRSSNYKLEILVQRSKGCQQNAYYKVNTKKKKYELRECPYKTEYTELINSPNYTPYKAVLHSTSTYLTDYIDENGSEKLSRGNIYTYFNDRCLGENTFEREQDGWANHIHHELYVYDKEVCKMLGVSFFKTLSNNHISPFTEVLACLQRKIKGKTMLHKDKIDKDMNKRNIIVPKKLHIIHTESVVEQVVESVVEPVVESVVEPVVEPLLEASNTVVEDTGIIIDNEILSVETVPEPTQVKITISANIIQQLEVILTTTKEQNLPLNEFLLESQPIFIKMFENAMA